MKQNEKLLVYAVTGFLVVILGIAVLFGKDGSKPPAPEAKEGTQSLTSILEGTGAIPKAADKDKVGTEPGAGANHNTGLPNPGEVGIPGGKPLVATPPPVAADELRLALGPSRRERDFRIVKAKRGDTLGKLVETWCGSVDQLEVAKGINEKWETLKAGDDVTLPWVDDDKVLAAWQQDHPAAPAPGNGNLPASNVVPANAGGNGSKPVEAVANGGKPEAAPKADAAPVAATRLYKLKHGESLWKVAEREVGRAGANDFIEKVKALNRNVADFERLREGVELRLPAKPSQS